MADTKAAVQSYDYVIIGGGTAGLVLASRLTEDENTSVAVLEAGEERLDDPNVDIPGLMNVLYANEKYDWYFKTVPQEGLNNRIVHWPRGKMLGGTSANNFMMLTHASRVDLDNWEKLGNTGWNFDSLQPYYRKSETYNPPSDALAKEVGASILDKSLHGTSGPLQSSFPEGQGDADKAWGPTFATLGLGPKKDPREGSTLGGFSILKSIKNGVRSHSGRSYYNPIRDRKNLTVFTNAFVKKIAFSADGDQVKATGVSYSIGNTDFDIKPREEVLLCAGTIQSPQLLELSGIGSKEVLEAHGVDVVLNNPNVGENLQDHMLIPLAFEVNDGVPTAEAIKQPGVLEWALAEWKEKGAGPLAGGVTGSSFLSYESLLSNDTKDSQLKKLQQLVDQISPNTPGLAKQLELQKEMLLSPTEADIQFNFGATGMNPDEGDNLSTVFSHSDPGGYIGIPTANTHAFSRGSIHIQSSDAKDHPIVDPKYLSHPVDIELLAAGLLFVQKLASTPPLANLLKDSPSGEGKIIQPAFGVTGALTDEKAREIIKNSGITSFHPVATCSMLPKEDGGVVDTSLKVYGTQNVRVIDASIIPLHVRGNIQSLVYAIAEKAADIIKSERVH